MAKKEKQEKPEHSRAYNLGYASTLNGSKLGFSLYNLVDEAQDKAAVLQVILDYSKAYDHARDRMKTHQPQVPDNAPKKTR